MSDKIETLKEIFNDIEAYKALADIVIPEVSNYFDRLSDGITDLKFVKLNVIKIMAIREKKQLCLLSTQITH